MKVKEFEVYGFMGRDYSIVLKLNDDLNIITGKNGSGKTTLLKLMWYIMSGNILIALREVRFKRAKLVTDMYECTIDKLSHNTCKVKWKDETGEYSFEDAPDFSIDDEPVLVNAEDQVNPKLISIGSSIFLPTFRRIEGGFSTKDNLPSISRNKIDIEESLQALSKKLSNGNHTFVSALSTVDVVSLLVRKYADLSEMYNDIQKRTSQDVMNKIKEFKRKNNEDSADVQPALDLIDKINNQIQNMESERELLLTPIEVVKELATKFFAHAGIRLTKNFGFGDAANSVSSDELSAGEKQMFSFIAYNSFYNDSIFIIDEPELSLHVDWQRQLFPTLLSQGASNQFIIATHSPFIYSKYPDKEVQIDEDRGCSVE